MVRESVLIPDNTAVFGPETWVQVYVPVPPPEPIGLAVKVLHGNIGLLPALTILGVRDTVMAISRYCEPQLFEYSIRKT